MTLTAAPGDERVKQALDIDPVGLHPARPAVDLQAGRLHDPTRDAALFEEPRQPEAIIARLITERQLWHPTRYLCQAVPRRIELSHQAFGVTAPDWIQARVVPVRKLDRQEPAVLAQLKRGMECVFGCGNRCRPCHGISLLLIDVEIIEGA